MAELNALLDEVRAGNALHKGDRLFALEELMQTGSYRNDRLAQLLGVTDRQLRRDKTALRQRYQQRMRDYAVVGEMFGQFQATLARIDQAIEAVDYAKVKALTQRWGVVESFCKQALPAQLEDHLAALEVALHEHSNPNPTP